MDKKTDTMIALIEKYICKKRNIDPAKLHERNAKGKLYRDKELVLTRQLVVYYALQNGYSQKRAGEYYYQDHATAYHAKDKIDNQRRIYRQFRDEISEYDEKMDGIFKLDYKELVEKLSYNSEEKIELIKTVLPELEASTRDIENRLKSINCIIFDLQKETSRTDVEPNTE